MQVPRHQGAVRVRDARMTVMMVVPSFLRVFMEKIKARRDVSLHEVTLQNRDTLHLEILSKLDQGLKRPS